METGKLTNKTLVKPKIIDAFGAVIPATKWSDNTLQRVAFSYRGNVACSQFCLDQIQEQASMEGPIPEN
jgi:hypothetical protein